MGTKANIPATVTNCSVLVIAMELEIAVVALLDKLTCDQCNQLSPSFMSRTLIYTRLLSA